MLYRKIPKTGKEVSVIGLGGEYLDNKPASVAQEVVERALERGINIIDCFMPGRQVRENIAAALGSRRKDVVLQGHFGSCDDDNLQYDRSRNLDVCKRYIDEFMDIFKTDYIDAGMMVFIDSEEDYHDAIDSPYFDYCLDLKRQGVFKMLGVSSHNPTIAAKLVKLGVLDLMLFSVNPAYDSAVGGTSLDALMGFGEEAPDLSSIRPERMELYRLCQKNDVAITCMKTLGAGKLLSAEFSPFEKPMTVAQCEHYALTRPAVVSTLIGCKSAAEVDEAVKYCELSDEQRDYTSVISGHTRSINGQCMYCSHCLPCPANIDIASVNRYLDIALLDENDIPEGTRSHYLALAAKGGDCLSCGSCETRCPFGVSIIDNMQSARRIFGK